MNQEKARNILEKIRQAKLEALKNYQEIGGNYVEYHIQKMVSEFRGVWNDQKAKEYINSLAAEEDMRELMDTTVEEY